jgi:CRISPR/Cas system-associated exonuclease Cas4 (RecB family)
MNTEEELDRYLEEVRLKEDGEHKDPEVNEFYASSALYCPRKIQWEKKHGLKPDSKLLRKFLIGNLIHDYLQKNIFTAEKGFKSEERKELEVDGIKIRGRIDIESDDEVIEIKSIARLPKDKLAHHVAQVGIYMAITGKKGKILYLEKTNGDICEFEVDKEEGDIAYREAIKLFKQCYEADVKGVEAPAKKDWVCRYCSNVDCSYSKGE